jgi:acetyltransferase
MRVARPQAGKPAARLAIEPYPAHLARRIELPGGGSASLRPIKPEDAPAIEAMFARMTEEDRRMRFFAPIAKLTPALLDRLTQIDYDREMALACEGADGFLGVVRLAADPDRTRAEYAIALRSDQKGHGLGLYLMRRILDYAKSVGIGAVFGEILRENRPMLEICRALGFVLQSEPDMPEIVRAEIALAGWPALDRVAE